MEIISTQKIHDSLRQWPYTNFLPQPRGVMAAMVAGVVMALVLASVDGVDAVVDDGAIGWKWRWTWRW